MSGAQRIPNDSHQPGIDSIQAHALKVASWENWRHKASLSPASPGMSAANVFIGAGEISGAVKSG